VGVAGVSWSQADHSQIYGLYQQLLRHFSEMGVLLAVASKNEMSVVEQALARDDLFIPGGAFYPVRADWGPKSRHIEAILRAWNIGADSVVFIDDSPMELDEVRTAFPSMTCLQFPGKPSAGVELLEQLRDLFGKPVLQKEDALRQSSLKAFNESALVRDNDAFVRGLNGKVIFDLTKNGSNGRLLELINKTNQFNLNGVRVTEAEWLRHLADPAGFVAGISYADKFGPLGVIGVVAGKKAGDTLEISTWVMSCRAFSRRIEFHTLGCLFETSGSRNISLAYRPTERNQPLQEFIGMLGGVQLDRDGFAAAGYDLPHQVSITGRN
jgi:FkbH-like protein